MLNTCLLKFIHLIYIGNVYLIGCVACAPDDEADDDNDYVYT